MFNYPVAIDSGQKVLTHEPFPFPAVRPAHIKQNTQTQKVARDRPRLERRSVTLAESDRITAGHGYGPPKSTSPPSHYRVTSGLGRRLLRTTPVLTALRAAASIERPG
jgi:hypothetical protein